MSCSDTIGFDRLPRRVTLVLLMRASSIGVSGFGRLPHRNHPILLALNRRLAVIFVFRGVCFFAFVFPFSMDHQSDSFPGGRCLSQLVFLFRKIVGSLHGERNCFPGNPDCRRKKRYHLPGYEVFMGIREPSSHLPLCFASRLGSICGAYVRFFFGCAACRAAPVC